MKTVTMKDETEEWDKSDEQYNEWENSVDEIRYRLNWTYGGNLEKYKYLVAQTLQKIPEEARETIIEKTHFIAAYTEEGYMERIGFNISPEPPEAGLNKREAVIVVLNFAEMEHQDRSPEQMMDTIAHECAHVYLEHYKRDRDQDFTLEREAEDLLESWGFNRTYSEEKLKEIETGHTGKP